MCGIAGIAAAGGAPMGSLERLADRIRHRGPDSDGYHRRGNYGLAVRRLRIIDLETGDQPIRSMCTGATIAYNGELYNARELRAELESKGHRFGTDADTEVVLHFYEEFGIREMHRFNGIFAFAIDDPRSDSLVLVRDQLGVKPLYVAQPAPNTVVFASEPKAILASGLVDDTVDRVALGNYLTYGHAVGGRTIYASIRKVPAGHALVVEPGSVRLQRYWSLRERARRWDPGAPAPREEVEALLNDAVQRNMIADVPVGAFLSGGVDSSLVTALMRKFTPALRTYSVGFGDAQDELPDALRVARALGTDHTAITMTPEDAATHFGLIARIYDEPFADAAALPTYFVAKRAREDVTVVLTGEGGDELFGGYRRYVAEQAYGTYRMIPRRLRALAAGLPTDRIPKLRRVGRTLRALASDDRASRYSIWTETFSAAERAELMDGHEPNGSPYAPYAAAVADFHEVRDSVVAMMAVEVETWLVDAYLEKVDKATMAVSLEARVPLLDPRLVELIALAPRSWKLRGAATKMLLKEIAAAYIPPENVRKRKQGFGPPYEQWLRTSLRARVAELSEPDAKVASLLEPSGVRRLIAAFERGEPRAPQVWNLLVLDEWARNRGAPRGL